MAQRWEEALAALKEAFPDRPDGILLAGGGVRDLILEREPRDIDLLLEASDSGARNAALARLEATAGMAPVVFERRLPITYRVVIREVVVDVSFFEPRALTEALGRRDFTMNSMAVPLGKIPPAGQRRSATIAPHVVDPFDGLADLQSRRITLTAVNALDEDPLRALRAIRLAAELPELAIDEDLESTIRSVASRIVEPAPERISAEIEIIFATSRAGKSLRSMQALGLLFPIFPDLEPLRGLAQPRRHHDHDVLEHTMAAVEHADALATGCDGIGSAPLDEERTRILKWAALCHDIGKAATASVGEDGTPHFYGHETVSAELAAAALSRLRVPGRIAAEVVALIEMHLRLGALASSGGGDRPIGRLVRASGARLLLLALLSIADRRAAGGIEVAERERTLMATARRAFALQNDLAARAAPPLLSGIDVMRILNLQPGPRVGSILRWIERLHLEGRLASPREAEELLRGLPPPRIED